MHGAAVAAIASSLVYCRASAPPSQAPSPPVAGVAGKETIARPLADAGAFAEEPLDEDARSWARIDAAVRAAIDEGKLPGCVVVVGRHDEILFERAYGSRSVQPERTPMTLDTVFDLASLTKPVATATSIMILVERGKVDLDARASKYVPELAKLPPFTVRQLLTHTSGLPAGTPMSQWSQDRAEVLRNIGALTLKARPGERFSYSDVGFVVLQEIVERVGGKPLSRFADEEIFAPLRMNETGYLPPPALRERAAPTEPRDGRFMQGEVHDPRAFALGGVAGHAGVFSTARDMARFARMMLRRGELDGRRIFTERTFERFVAPHETPEGARALGWDVASTFAKNKSPLMSSRAFGHGGFTGTGMWIDPERDLFVVFLSNRVHPDGKGAVNPLIAEIGTIAADAAEVKTGIDVLRAEAFARLRGRRVGLVTNASAKAKDGTRTVDVLRAAGAGAAGGAEGFTLVSIFTPEHGLFGDREGAIADGTYEGLPVHTLYGPGERFEPTAEALAGIDTIVFDLQDVGVRFYTYASTMKRVMRVAAERRLRFVVLDRPNPIGGVEVQGPVLREDAERRGRDFVNYHPLPLRHGMTMGELARLFVEDERLELDLDVVRMVGWRRKDGFARTGLAWSAPSPNLRSLRAVDLYPAIGLLESTNVSVGRGTPTPFEVVAAPWLNAKAVAKKLTERGVPGVTFEPTEITPTSSVHANKRCRAIRIAVTEPDRFEPIRTGLAIAVVLHEVHPTEWQIDRLDRMLRHAPALEAVRAGKDAAEIEATWADELAAFKQRRERALLYR